MTSTFSFKMAQEYFIDILVFRLKRNAVDSQMNHHAVSCDNNYFRNYFGFYPFSGILSVTPVTNSIQRSFLFEK